MNFSRLLDSASTAAKQNGPKWATRAGYIGMGIGAIWLAKKAGEKHIVADAQEDIKAIKSADGDHKEEVKKVVKETVVSSAKSYWAPATVLVGSFVVGNIGCTKMDQQKVAAEAALLSTLGFLTRYRSKVRGEVGEDKEHELYLDARHPEVNGNGSINNDIYEGTDQLSSSCTYVWGPTNEDGSINNAFDPHSDVANFMTVRALCEDFNRKLEDKHVVKFTEVADKLDLPMRSYLYDAGWTADRDSSGRLYSPLGGDGYISFGLKTKKNELGNRVIDVSYYVDNEDLMHDNEESHDASPIVLDFNFDGDIRPYFQNKEKRFLIPSKNRKALA